MVVLTRYDIQTLLIGSYETGIYLHLVDVYIVGINMYNIYYIVYIPVPWLL